MRKSLEKLINKKVQLNIREIQQPEFDAYLVARSIAESMERRVAYRRALKQALQRSIVAGAKGMRIRAAGRLDGAEIARTVTMHEGRVPLHTLRADIDYGFTEAKTVMGRIGIKVWIYKGEILPVKAEEAAETAAPAISAPAADTKAAVAESVMSEISAEKLSAVKEELTKALAEKHTVRRIRKPAAEKAAEVVEAPAAVVEDVKAAKPAAKRVRKPVGEKIEEAVHVEETEEKHTAKKTSPASAAKPKTVKPKKTASDVTDEPAAEK
jgi:small subunit ribosomal protein S3